MSDAYPREGAGFIDVYPIANRKTATGLWYTESIRGQYASPPGEPSWPPESDPAWDTPTGDADGKEQWMWYADVIDGLDGSYWYSWENGAAEYYGVSDSWYGIELFSEYTENYSSTFDHYQRTYLTACGWLHYDLSGIDTQAIQRAEWVANLYHSNGADNPDNPNFVVQVRSGMSDYHGWRPSPHDYETMRSGSNIPAMTISEIEGRGADHEYTDQYADIDYWGDNPSRHALPLDQAGLQAMRAGGQVGIYFGLDGRSKPTGRNGLFVDCRYDWWDDNIDAGPTMAGYMLPSLRLWVGGELEIAGEAIITLDAQAHVQPPPRDILTHQARILRDQS